MEWRRAGNGDKECQFLVWVSLSDHAVGWLLSIQARSSALSSKKSNSCLLYQIPIAADKCAIERNDQAYLKIRW